MVYYVIYTRDTSLDTTESMFSEFIISSNIFFNIPGPIVSNRKWWRGCAHDYRLIYHYSNRNRSVLNHGYWTVHWEANHSSLQTSVHANRLQKLYWHCTSYWPKFNVFFFVFPYFLIYLDKTCHTLNGQLRICPSVRLYYFLEPKTSFLCFLARPKFVEIFTLYCGIIIVCRGPMFASFVGNSCPRIYFPTKLYTIIWLLF